jgi:hypothetical protein
MLLLFLFAWHFDESAATEAINVGLVGREVVGDS